MGFPRLPSSRLVPLAPHPPAASPQVSFVIPLFNNLALTRACVESLQATLPRGLAPEIILVDDGSTDGTRDWLKSLAPPFRVVLNERNLGYAVANNRAAALATGKYLALLNNDLVLLPRWLDHVLAAHRSLGAQAGLVGNIQRDFRTGAIDHTGIIINRSGKPEHDRTPPSLLTRIFRPVRRVPAVTGACVVLERALWEKLGGFDEAYVNGGEDIDLCFRARAAGHVNAVALRSVVRHHISSSIGRKLHDEENSYRLARRWRREFVAAADLATRAWCRDYLEKIGPDPRLADRVLARRAWFYARHLRATPPSEAVDDLEAALDREFARWKEMFGR
jgi:GT2 family glycosyltransferase